MIIPNKYIRPSESIMYLSTIILKQIEDKKYDVVDLWLEIKKVVILHIVNFCKY